MDAENATEKEEARSEFQWRIKLGTIAGLPLYLHLSYLLWLFLFFWVDKVSGILFISMLFFSISIHELSHALACRYLGFGGGTLTIWFLGGYFIPFSETALFKMDRKQKVRYSLMIFAGPFSNLVLSGIFLILPEFVVSG